jgi:hypothetical protein
VASRIYSTQGEWEKAAAKSREGLAAKSAAMEGPLSEAKKAAGVEVPPPPPAPVITPPPSRGLHDFLAPVEGEAPETSILKLIQAVGIFATGISGSARGDARAGLAALTGAMRGWQEGDKERADRHFADWKAFTDASLTKWQTERTTYHDIMESANLSIEQKFKLVQLTATQQDNRMLADAAAKGDLETLLRILTDQQKHEDTVALHRDSLAQAKAEKDRAFEEKVREFNERMALERTTAAAFTPDAIEMAAQLYARTGQMPPMGMGKSGVEVRGRILNRAADIYKAAGTEPGDLAGKMAFYKATQAELTRLQGQRGVVMAFAGTADRNLELALELSKKVDRTGTPVYNRWLLAGRRAVAGDVDVVKFDAAVRVAINEFAKVTSSATGGGVTSDQSRQEVESMLNVAQTKAQFEGVVETLRKDMGNRKKGYDDQIESIRGALQAAGPAPAGAGGAAGGGKMRIRRIGTTGPIAEGPEGPIPPGWEKAQ